VTARERLDAIEALLADVREDADLAAEPSYTTANIVSKHLAEKRTLQEHVPAMRAALAALVAGHLAQPQPDLCPRCDTTPAEIEGQHLAAADDSLYSPNEGNDR
jgi:hypothetical protein